MSDPIYDNPPPPEPSPSPPVPAPETPIIQDAGAGGPAWRVGLSPWPIYGQLADWTADAAPDENRANNCVPESIAMCIKYITGVELPADYIKDVEYGEGYQGYTSFSKASWFLSRFCEIPNGIWEAPHNAGALWHVWNALRQGHPCIGLFEYNGKSSGLRHVMPYIYLDAHTVKVVDPWRAEVLTWDYATHDRWSHYTGLTMTRKRHI